MEVGAFGEVLAEETVGVVVGSTLPWTLRVAEVDVEVGVCAELSVLGHFDSLVPGQRAAELLGQGGDRRSDSVSYGLGAVAGKRGPVVDSLLFSVAWHGWEVSQHRESGGPLHQCSDRGTPKSDDVGSDRGALSAFRLVGFPGPPSEPDVQLPLHPALHVFMPLVYCPSVQLRLHHTYPPPQPQPGRATVRRYSPATSAINTSAANTLDPFAM